MSMWSLRWAGISYSCRSGTRSLLANKEMTRVMPSNVIRLANSNHIGSNLGVVDSKERALTEVYIRVAHHDVNRRRPSWSCLPGPDWRAPNHDSIVLPRIHLHRQHELSHNFLRLELRRATMKISRYKNRDNHVVNITGCRFRLTCE